MIAHPYNCPNCGKKAPKATGVVWVRESKMSEAADSRWWRHVVVSPLPKNKAECQKLTNQIVVSLVYNHDKTEVMRFGEWDGVHYWHRYEPFCSTPCAIEFARAAHEAGYRRNPKARAA